MMKFSKNINIFTVILMTSFYFNTYFHLRISFDSDTTDYETTRARIKARKINDITVKIKELLIFDRKQLKKIKISIKAQINKHRRDVIYKIND